MGSLKSFMCSRNYYWINKQTHSLRLAFSLRQHKLHSSSLINICWHRNLSTEVVLCFFCLHCNCKCVCLNLLWCNLVGSLWAGCSVLYFLHTGRICWNNGTPVQVRQMALPSSREQHLGAVCMAGERWWLLPYLWHECASRRSPVSSTCNWIALPSVLQANILLSSCG